jgi:hypothetical protein
MSDEIKDAMTDLKADVQLMRKDLLSTCTELKRQLVWYMLAFAQVALEAGLIHALR